jgi:DNA-binding MarR family transcriptional regulator
VTGLKDYEVSRACRFLAKSGLVTMEKGKADARNRMLTPTPKGLKIRNKVLLVAARRMRGTHWAAGSLRQLEEATEMFRVANRLLLGPLQLSLYEENRR